MSIDSKERQLKATPNYRRVGIGIAVAVCVAFLGAFILSHTNSQPTYHFLRGAQVIPNSEVWGQGHESDIPDYYRISYALGGTPQALKNVAHPELMSLGWQRTFENKHQASYHKDSHNILMTYDFRKRRVIVQLSGLNRQSWLDRVWNWMGGRSRH